MKRVQFLREIDQGTAVYGVTQFADLTEDEFKKSKLGLKKDDSAVDNLEDMNEELYHLEDIPKAFDWRTKGAVTPVKNQGNCGSCWAFSVTGNVEGLYYLEHKNLLSFSENELIDCDKIDMRILAPYLCSVTVIPDQRDSDGRGCRGRPPV